MVHRQDPDVLIIGAAVTSESDEELAARAATDPTAFSEIHRRYVDRMYRYCGYRLRGEHEVEDATSKIFLRALEGLHRSHITHLRPWLFSIAHNVVMDHYRDRRSDIDIDAALEVPSDGFSPEAIALANSDSSELHAAMAHLSADQRRVVELRLAGLTGPEIRYVLGKSRSWVDTTQFRALRRLRELLAASDTDRKS